MLANCEDPDQTPRSGSALLAYVPKMGLIWVKIIQILISNIYHSHVKDLFLTVSSSCQIQIRNEIL